jgi:hypothetical protein
VLIVGIAGLAVASAALLATRRSASRRVHA